MDFVAVLVLILGVLGGGFVATRCVRGVSSWLHRVAGWVAAFLSCAFGTVFFAMALFPSPKPAAPNDPSAGFLLFLAVFFWAAVAYAIWHRSGKLQKAKVSGQSEVIPTPAPAAPSGAPNLLCVSLLGLDAEATQRMQQLCTAEGFEATTGEHSTAVLAIVPNGRARGYALSYPAVSVVAAPAALQLVSDRVRNHPKAASLHNLRVAVDFSRASFDPDFAPSQEPPAAFDPDHSAFLALPAMSDSVLESPALALSAPASPRRSKAKRSSQTPVATPAPSITLPCTFAFSYRAQDGDYALRTVKVTGISSNGGHAYLEGFCNERMDTRTFRTDRIRGDLMDTHTGELLSATRLLTSVRTRTRMDYKPPAPQIHPAKEWQTAVLFTGFTASRRDELEGIAEAAGWSVRVTVGSTLDYLVTGPRAGPSKVAKSRELGVGVIDEDMFRLLIG